MKYMTKEWYDKMQKTNLCGLLEIDERASSFSEEYFKELYQKKEEEFRKQKRKGIETVNRAKREGLFKDLNIDYEKLLAIYEKGNFTSRYKRELESVKEKIPNSILKEIKDIRIFALGYTTEDIYLKLKKISEENQRQVEQAIKDHTKYTNDLFKNQKIDFLENNYHDTIITKVEKGKDYIIELDNSHSFSKVVKIVFKDVEVIKEEAELEDARWLYEELYLTDNMYEVHILVAQYGLNDFIIKCSDIEVYTY